MIIVHLNIFNLSQNYLDVEHYFNDATLPKLSNKELIHLDFSYYRKLSFAAVDHIFMLLKHCTSLTHLNLHSCSIAKSTELEAFLQYNHNLQYLNICNCNLLEEEMIIIFGCLRKSNSIQHLLLNCNIITNVAAKVLASLIIQWPTLTQLALSDCELEEKGMIAVCESLKRISSLKRLDLSYNIINGEAVYSLASALSNNTSLEYLNLSYCTWTNNGLSMIQSVLINFKNYEKLISAHCKH